MRTWLITGVSSGFGRAIAEKVVAAGDRVIGTVRSSDARVEFEKLNPALAVGVLLDVTHDDDVARVVTTLERDVGPIDVLVNNAGYGHEGSIEETSMEAFRAQFAVNVFGAVAVIKAVLPFMRARRRGHIINITSMGGIVTFPGLGVYHGSKFALEGISETLAKEVAAFGIKVTAVEPGAFRTEWAGRSMTRREATIADYDALLSPLSQARAERNGKQPGDPQRAADAIVTIVNSGEPPVHLLLGTDALGFVRTKLDHLSSEIELWASVSSGTNFSS
jgi:NAD(P)-dependent dehydrogenase (short-subunit alcohol dehydrogenase family)